MSDNSWNTSDESKFSGDDDVVNNTGTINVFETATFSGLENLNNKADGTISLMDGDTSEVLTTTGDYTGTAGAVLKVDTHLGADGDGSNSSDEFAVNLDLKGETGPGCLQRQPRPQRVQ